MKREYTLERKVKIKYNCTLPDDFKGTVKEFVQKYGIEKLFENSIHEKTIKYSDPDLGTIVELDKKD